MDAVPDPAGIEHPAGDVSVLGWLALAATLLLIAVGAGGAPARRRGPVPGGVRPSWRLGSRAATRPPEARSVAFVVDLLAGVLAAGSPPELAIARVAAAVTEHGTPSLRHAVEPLSRVGRLLQLGSDPAAAWASLHQVPGYGAVADSGRRCAASGARLASTLAAVAEDLRAGHQTEALARAARAGVWTLLPLGLCFLPAFVCLGVVPVVLGVAGQVFTGVPG